MKNILLVEDDQFLIDIYKTELEEAEFNVEVVFNGEDFFKKIEEKNPPDFKNVVWPDLLVLDIVLPKVNGWEILNYLKNDQRFKNLKIVILSNLGQKSDIEKGFSLGAAGYFVKTRHTPLELIDEIKKILK